MKKAGYTVEENSDSFNGGWEEENRETELKLTLPKTAEGSVRLVRVALGEVQPGPTGDYFVSASRFSDGPGGRSGIGISSNLDPLDELFNG